MILIGFLKNGVKGVCFLEVLCFNSHLWIMQNRLQQKRTNIFLFYLSGKDIVLPDPFYERLGGWLILFLPYSQDSMFYIFPTCLYLYHLFCNYQMKLFFKLLSSSLQIFFLRWYSRESCYLSLWLVLEISFRCVWTAR